METDLRHHIDYVTIDQLLELGNVEGPNISLYLPTGEFGADPRLGPTTLKNLVADVRTSLSDEFRRPDLDDLVAPIEALIDDTLFWQRQGAGLAIFRAPDHFTVLRLPLAVSE